jgi:hypothetical protein
MKVYNKLSLLNDFPNHDGTPDMHFKALQHFGVEPSLAEYYEPSDLLELITKGKFEVNVIRNKRGDQVLIEPSTGLRTIYKCLKLFTDSDIYITGFDTYETSKYWDDKYPIWCMDIIKEKVLLAKLVAQKLVTDIGNIKV